MLSLKRCREIFGSNCVLADSELELLRDQLYGLAHMLVEAGLERRRGEVDSIAAAPVILDGGKDRGSARSIKSLQDSLKLLPPDYREDLEERAAIHEFDGGLGRDEAERAAIHGYWRFKVN